jgi:proline racemase
VEHLDHLRTLLMCEPRGHASMSGAILQPPTRPDADYGVLFIEVSGCLPMCGHGTIGVATVLVETGMVPVVEPVTTVRLDTPAGLVTAEVRVEDGAATAVTLANVPAYCVVLDRKITLPSGRSVTYDLAYGGNFYAILPLEQFDLPFDRARKDEILAAGLELMAAINAEDEPVHPLDSAVRGCHHVQFLAPDATPEHSRHAMAIYPGWFDRSPCGTGTCARMAQLHARGQLAIGEEFVNESFIGTRFTGRLVGETTIGGKGSDGEGHGTSGVPGLPGVLPTVTGRAWITGTAQYMLDPTDPFPAGFVL